MANPIRRIHDAHFKTKVVLEVLKRQKTLAQLSSELGIHAQMITERSGVPVETTGVGWSTLPFRDDTQRANHISRATRTNRISFVSTDWAAKSGRRAVENDYLKKKIRTS